MTDPGPHAACVDAWLARAEGAPPALLVALFDAGLHALWARTKTTLGEITLTAIADRVLHDASERFPLFSALRVEPTAGFHCGDLRARVQSTSHAGDLRLGARFVMVEFLTVLGNLTADVLSAELHSVLSNVTVPEKGNENEPS